LISGDAVTSVTLTSAGAAMAAAAGTSAITPSAAVGTGLSNYTISYVDGTMTVNALPIASIAGTTNICTGTTTTLTASATNGLLQGLYQYNWNSTSFSGTAAFTTPVLLANASYSVTAKNTVTGCISLPANVTITTNDCAPKVDITVAIEGAYSTTTGLMNDGLRSNNKIPSAQPYNTLTFTGTTGANVAYNGTETVAPSVLALLVTRLKSLVVRLYFVKMEKS
jgi:hypothetical protein